MPQLTSVPIGAVLMIGSPVSGSTTDSPLLQIVVGGIPTVFDSHSYVCVQSNVLISQRSFDDAFFVVHSVFGFERTVVPEQGGAAGLQVRSVPHSPFSTTVVLLHGGRSGPPRASSVRER